MIRTTRPTAGNKYFITKSSGGYYTCIKGSLALGQCEQKDKIYLKTDDGIYELTPQKFDGNEYGFCGYFTQEIDLSKAHIEVLGVKR